MMPTNALAAPLFDNNALFDAVGHLTDEGLRALCEGTLDPLGRLEAGEHLSFCDYCLARYTTLVERMPQRLQAPMRDLVPQIQALMRRRSFRIFTNRYFSAAAAVILCFTMWQFGLFGLAAPTAPGSAGQPLAFTWGESVQDALSGFGENISDLLDDFHAAAQAGLARIDDAIAAPGGPTTIKE